MVEASIPAEDCAARSAPSIGSVERIPSYFKGPRGLLLGHLHRPAESEPEADIAVVLCNPIGFEYMHAHRSVRHLADRLARAGIATLRFDYDGTGDSVGDDTEQSRLSVWTESVVAAAAFVRAQTGHRRVCLVGIRFGATLAALAAPSAQAEYLLLWNPCISGRRYVRELQAISLTASMRDQVASDVLDSAGFVLSGDTVNAIVKIDLRKYSFSGVKDVLVLGRDDLSADLSLNQRLDALGIENHYAAAPGYSEMMAEPQFTQVPEQAIDSIAEWIDHHVAARARRSGTGPVVESCTFQHTSDLGSTVLLEERICRFGPNNELFGVLTRPSPNASTTHPCVVLPNAGAAHHVGPNRFYVALAHELAAAGTACLRFDLEGLGDSVLSVPGPENHPYPETAVRDVKRAFDFMNERFGHESFVPLGLCSGAHSAFHAALELEAYRIPAIVLINPLTYRFVEGMTLATSRHFWDLKYYKESARSLEKWKKLARLEVDWGKITRLGLVHAKRVVLHEWHMLREWIDPRQASETSRDLERLFAGGRHIGLFISSGDPGYEILMQHAQRTARRGIREGKIHLEIVPNSDHTFSPFRSRRNAIHRICGYVQTITELAPVGPTYPNHTSAEPDLPPASPNRSASTVSAAHEDALSGP